MQDLELDVPPVPRLVVGPLRQMGQVLFRPPNVRGWVGGRAWINSGSLAARRALAESLFNPLNERALNQDELLAVAAARGAGRDNFGVADERLQPLLSAGPEGRGRAPVLRPVGGAARPGFPGGPARVPRRRQPRRSRSAPPDPPRAERGARRGRIPALLRYRPLTPAQPLPAMADNPSTPFLPTTRREFLRRSGQGLGLVAFSRFAPSFLVTSALGAAPAPEKDRSVLVLVQLAGGNDGLNTVIPFEDDNYRRLRPTLGIPKEQVLPDQRHPGPASVLRGHGRALPGRQAGHRAERRLSEPQPQPLPVHRNLGDGERQRHLRSPPAGSAGTWTTAAPGLPAADHDPLAVHLNTLNGEPETFLGEQRRIRRFGLRRQRPDPPGRRGDAPAARDRSPPARARSTAPTASSSTR